MILRSIARRVHRAATAARDMFELIADVAGLAAALPEEVEPEVEPEVDETEAWPVPAQNPHTAASRALEWRPHRPSKVEPEVEPVAGSAAARVRAARLAG